MSARLSEIGMRRSQLVARAALQRERLSSSYHRFEKPVAFVRKAGAAIKFLRSPLVATALTFLFARKKRKTHEPRPSLLMKGWRLIRTISRLKAHL